MFRRHSPRLHAYVKRRLGLGLADDVVAEAFATAFRQREKFDGRAEFGAWRWGIAGNVIARRHRQGTRMYRAFARTGVDPPRAASPSWPAIAPPPRRTGLSWRGPSPRCSAQDRNVILLRAWGELSYAEIAAALSLPSAPSRPRSTGLG